MKMQQRQFRIGELAKRLDVEKFVIRFWEKEFNVKTQRSDGKQRFYSERDAERFELIKDLLYKQGFTIAGAKQRLNKIEPNIIAASKIKEPEQFAENLLNLQKQLMKLKELLK